jgi:hypothetical protein
VERGGTGLRIVMRTNEAERRDYQSLELSEDLTRGEAILDPTVFGSGGSPFPLSDPLHEIWTSFLLMRGRGLLVHACGVLRGDGVHLFVGRSGAGKTTMARLLAAAGAGEILSDDRLVVRPRDDGFEAWGTPWRGVPDLSSAAGGGLASVSFLVQADESRRVALGPEEAAARLFDACCLVGWPREGIGYVLGTTAGVAERVPCHELRFLPEPSAVAAAGMSEVER